jgi:hypothetical protein
MKEKAALKYMADRGEGGIILRWVSEGIILVNLDWTHVAQDKKH